MSGNLKRKAPPTPSSTAKKTRSIASFFRPAASPSSSNSGSSTSSTNGSGDIATSTLPKFNKATWLSTLTPEQRTLLSLELSSIGPSYLGLLAPLLTTPQFLSLKAFLASERGPVYPPAPQIYTWTRLCPLPSVRVVVLGQDPYHGPGQAMGLSFSVSPPTPAPPSLGNIYKALARDYPDFRPPPGRGGDLSPWARRGVLLLNAALTVRRGEAASHAGKGWEKITGAVLSHLAKGRGCVFMVWGADAQKRVKEVGIDENKHLVLRSVHPSPLSAHRGWFDCGHFKKANEWLEARYGEAGPIDWSLHGSTPVGVKRAPAKVEDKKVEDKKVKETEKKDDEDEFGFDDEEEAMVEAAVEAENAAKAAAEAEKEAVEKAAKKVAEQTKAEEEEEDEAVEKAAKKVAEQTKAEEEEEDEAVEKAAKKVLEQVESKEEEEEEAIEAVEKAVAKVIAQAKVEEEEDSEDAMAIDMEEETAESSDGTEKA